MTAPPAERIGPLLDAVAEAAPDAAERRAPSRELFERIAALGLLQILPPRAYGGQEATARQFLELVETVTRRYYARNLSVLGGFSVSVEADGRLGRIQLNRPDSLNPLSTTCLEELVAAAAAVVPRIGTSASAMRAFCASVAISSKSSMTSLIFA